jgi:probable HAF family extracellular repeat protein
MKTVLAACLLPASFVLATAMAGPTYTLTDIGTIGGKNSGASGISSNGFVTGGSSTEGEASVYAFIYRNGKITSLGDLGGTSSVGWSVNASGDVVGYFYGSTVNPTLPNAYLYQEGTIAPVPTPANFVSYGYSINDSGEYIVISSEIGTSLTSTFIYSAGTTKTISAAGYTSVVGTAINAQGQVTGAARLLADNSSHAFLYSGTQLIDLGVPTNSTYNAGSYGNAISNTGVVVGQAWNSSGNADHAFLAQIGSNIDIGTLASPYNYGSVATGVNSDLDVVGYSTTTSGNPHGFLYSNGLMTDLNTLVRGPLAKYVTLTDPAGINDAGQIASDGIDSRTGAGHAYLLNPVMPLTLSCPATTAQVGEAYKSSFTSTGGVAPNVFSVSSGALPAGLELNLTTGAVSGTPTTAASVEFTGKVVDYLGTAEGGTVTRSCEITVKAAPSVQMLSVSPSTLAFGSVSVNTLKIATVTLKNTGTVTVTLSDVSITPAKGTDSDDFTPIDSCSITLPAGKSCSVFVVLYVSKKGSLEATLNVPSSATQHPQEVTLTATGNLGMRTSYVKANSDR